MGRPTPGYTVPLLDPLTGEPGDEGEICLDLSERPVGLMTGYAGDPERTAEAMGGGYYHTGDIGRRDADGYITYIGRSRRRLQVLRLQDLAVRAGERAAGARGRRRGGGGARPRRPAAGGAQGVRRARRGLGAGRGDREGDLRALAGGAGPVQAGPAAGVRRAAQDRLRQDPPDRAARGDDARRQQRNSTRRTTGERAANPHSRGRAGRARAVVRARHRRAPRCSATPSAATWTGRSRRYPDREALVDVPSGRRWTYAEFGARRRPGGARAARPRRRQGRPGRHLGGQLPRVGAGAVRHRADRRDHGEHQPGLPAARAGVRAQAVRRRRC